MEKMIHNIYIAYIVVFVFIILLRIISEQQITENTLKSFS